MFKELAPLLRQRSLLLTVTHVGEDQFRVNVIPKKKQDSENDALTTPVSVTGTPEELDAELPQTLTTFVASHLELKNNLERAKADMEAAAKAAQEEARNKAKSNKKPSTEHVKKADGEKKEEAKKEPENPHAPGLFDSQPSHETAPAPTAVTVAETSVEDEIMEEIAEREDDENENEAA
jgi:PRTRC genetic system protein E